jgi:tRNA(Ile)-lysidine synthase
MAVVPKVKNKVALRFESDVLRAVRSLQIEKQEVLLAVSGGADSVAMACAFSRLKLSFSIASIDHQLRKESNTDVLWVKALAQQLGVTFHTKKVRILKKTGIEEQARNARYKALHQVARANKIPKIATAHTASDQAETLLMRLARGTALRGMAGIHLEREDGVVRPLLDATRREVLTYLESIGQTFLIDAMNQSLDFERVRMRLQGLPVLAQVHHITQDSLERNVARFAQLAAEDHAFIQRQADVLLNKPAPRKALLEISGAVRRRFWERLLAQNKLEISWRNIDECEQSLLQQRTGTLSGDVLIRIRKNGPELSNAPARSPRRAPPND